MTPAFRAKGGLDHQLKGVRLEAYVVVTEEEKGRTLHHQRRFVTGSGETSVLLEDPHEGVGPTAQPAR